MTRKIVALNSFVSASEASEILSAKLGRPIRPDYIRKLKNVGSVKINDRCKLYNRDDINAITIKQKRTK